MLDRAFAVLLVLSLLPVSAVAADPPTAEEEHAKQNLKEMKARVEGLKLEFAEKPDAQPLSLLTKPILRYGDPARIDADGTLWIWERDGQPLAVAAVWEGRPPAAKWTYELTSLADRPMKMTGRPWTWLPPEQKRKWITFEGKVPDAPRARLAAFRSFAEQFEATERYEEQTSALRLLPTPLHRYASESAGIIDGALFSLAHGTNPEVLIQLEARSGKEGANYWTASVARLSGASAEVKVSGVTQWTENEIKWFNHAENTPYFSTFDNDTLSQ
jgi:hypothetical protein